MKIVTKLEFKSYSRLMKSLFYKKVFVILTIGIGLIYVPIAIAGIVSNKLDTSTILIYGVGGIVILLMPYIAITLKTKKGFYSNKMLQEEIVYEFIDDKIMMTGTSFKSEMAWSKVHKVKELKDWFLIYQSKQLMNLIPKHAIGDQLGKFKTLIKSQKGLKYKLL